MAVSSAKSIQDRTLIFCTKTDICNRDIKILTQIDNFLNTEYNLIPEKERLGKGIKFISK